MRRKEKCKKAGNGRPAGRNKDESALLSGVSNNNWRVIQPGISWHFTVEMLTKQLVCFCMYCYRKKRFFEKKFSVMETLSTAVATTGSRQCSMLSQKMCPTRSWVAPHQMSLGVFQMKTFWWWMKQAVGRNGLEAENMAGTRLVTKFFSRKSEKLCKEWFDTLSRNLTQQSMGLVRITSLSPVSMDLRTRRPAGWHAKKWQMRPACRETGGMAGKEERGLSFDCEQS